MSWRGGEHERFPVRPQTTPTKDFLAYLHHGVHVYSKTEDLSLTATRMSSYGIPLLPTNPRERRLQSSHSDTKAIQMMKLSKETIASKRKGSLESARTLKFPPFFSTVRPPSGAILPPITSPPNQLVCETSTVTNDSECKTRIEEEMEEQDEEEDSSNEVDSSDEVSLYIIRYDICSINVY